MAKILDMPKLSPTMEEGVLQTWHKKEGDAVEVDDLLAEVETDKATMEFRAFDKGTILKILVDAGAAVKLGQPVAILGNAGENVDDLVAKAGSGGGDASAGGGEKEDANAEAEASNDREGDDGKAKSAKAKKPADDEAPETPRDPGVAAASKEKQRTATLRPGPAAAARSGPVTRGDILTRTEREAADLGEADGSNGRALASPYVRKLARERGIDLSTAQGTGDHGRILPSDLDAAPRARGDAHEPKANGGSNAIVKATSSAVATSGLAAPEARPLSPMRKTIARRLTQSKQTVPHFYLTIDVDAEALSALRESINDELAAKAPKSKDADAKPEKISLNDLIIKAVAAALVRVPECNAQFSDEALLIHKRVDVSVAVAIPDGLVTPVVRNADQKSVVAIAREVRDLASRARAKKLKPEEMSDGTFSISNLGMFGIDEFSAVINPPEGAILAVGRVRDEPVVKNGAVQPGKRLSMTLSCDHRVIDGAVGASFLAELRDLVEHPMRILTG